MLLPLFTFPRGPVVSILLLPMIRSLQYRTLLMAVILLLAGCRDFGVDPDGNETAGIQGDVVASLDVPFELSFGQRASIDDTPFSVEFTMVIEDNRCLQNVDCIQAGRAGVLLTVTDAQHTRYQLAAFIPGLVATPYTFNDIIQFQGYRFRLLRVNPYPQEGQQRDVAEYAVLLEVEPVNAP